MNAINRPCKNNSFSVLLHLEKSLKSNRVITVKIDWY